jgi:hypothetical protein
MSGTSQGSDEVDGRKHDDARREAEAASRAQARGERFQADRLSQQAVHTDPEAVENQLLQSDGPVPQADAGTADDAEIERISREIKPHADAPSRAGLTGSGSGADGMGE